MNRLWDMTTPVSLASRPLGQNQKEIGKLVRQKFFKARFSRFTRETEGDENLSGPLRPTITDHGMNAVKRRLS